MLGLYLEIWLNGWLEIVEANVADGFIGIEMDQRAKRPEKWVRVQLHLVLTCGVDFKLLSKVIAWLQLPRLVITLIISREFFNQWEAKPNIPCTRDFSRALSKLQVISINSE